MDREQFDALAQQVSTRHTRRAALATVLGALLLRQEVAIASARHKRHGRRRSHRPGKDKANRKGERHGQDKPRTQDCADWSITCWIKDAGDCCATLVHTFPPVGHCWKIANGCCPCDHRDEAYWTDQCNQTVPSCGGSCLAQDGPINYGCFGCPL